MNVVNALLQFQAINESNLPWLAKIYESSRHDKLALKSWPEEQRALFLQQQFDWQHKHYQQTYPNASYELVYQQDQVIGRLYIDRSAESIHIIDITLLPEFRNQGIGTEIILMLCAEAKERQSGRQVSLKVDKFNPAEQLYKRLGFREITHSDFYIDMLWQASLKMVIETKTD